MVPDCALGFLSQGNQTQIVVSFGIIGEAVDEKVKYRLRTTLDWIGEVDLTARRALEYKLRLAREVSARYRMCCGIRSCVCGHHAY